MDDSQAGRNNHPAVRKGFPLYCLLASSSCLCAVAAVAQDQATPAAQSFPQAEISNGLVHARLYLPDTARGYYRGTRFDWSGVMPDLDYNGHHYSGQWFKTYAPTIHDAIMGPVESFGPLGYDDATPGEGADHGKSADPGRGAGSGGRFIMIGIGALSRPDAKPYVPFRYYPIADPGKWRVKAGKDRVVFVQALSDSGYAYTYTKTVRLVKGKAELVLEHRLKNTGQKTIETDVYDHNLFPIDHQPTGPGLSVSFPFGLTGTQERRIGPGSAIGPGQGRPDKTHAVDSGDIARIEDNRIVFLRKPAGKEDVYTVLSGYGDRVKDYDIRIENRHTGAGLRITSDRPLSKLVFWASATTACPEAYIHIRVRPGEVFSWSVFYQLYDVSTIINEP